MSKNGIIAALWTAAIIGGFWGIIYSIKNYPQYMGYILSLSLILFVCVVFVYPLWDTIKWELDMRDREKRAKELWDESCRMDLDDLDLDDNDKNQIG
jgi:uncharacterized membrane protein